MILARRRLGLEIGALLAAKLVLLTVLYILFFGAPFHPQASAVASHVMGDR
jgi:hypothetical protein